jgi:ATP-dependent Clp protease adaptor protein ClpS
MSLESLFPDLKENIKKKQTNKYALILHNDEVNDFEHVMESLIEVCSHNSEQAEQCTLLAHLKGKCDIKHGEYSYLEPMREALLLRGISATIE